MATVTLAEHSISHCQDYRKKIPHSFSKAYCARQSAGSPTKATHPRLHRNFFLARSKHTQTKRKASFQPAFFLLHPSDLNKSTHAHGLSPNATNPWRFPIGNIGRGMLLREMKNGPVSRKKHQYSSRKSTRPSFKTEEKRNAHCSSTTSKKEMRAKE